MPETNKQKKFTANRNIPNRMRRDDTDNFLVTCTVTTGILMLLMGGTIYAGTHKNEQKPSLTPPDGNECLKTSVKPLIDQLKNSDIKYEGLNPEYLLDKNGGLKVDGTTLRIIETERDECLIRAQSLHNDMNNPPKNFNKNSESFSFFSRDGHEEKTIRVPATGNYLCASEKLNKFGIQAEIKFRQGKLNNKQEINVSFKSSSKHR